MKMRLHLCLLIILSMMIINEVKAAKGGGRGRGRSRGRVFGSRMPIQIHHKNPASATYYENKDVINFLKYFINLYKKFYFINRVQK